MTRRTLPSPRSSMVRLGSVAVAVVTMVAVITTAPVHAVVAPAGQVATWGGNSNGQLGDGTLTSHTTPVTAAGALSTRVPSTVATGEYHACALAEGKPYCWGNAGGGQLGNNTTTQSAVPVAVNTGGALNNKTITALSAGGSETCVVANARPYCWGLNNSGQLGNNTTTNSSVPIAVNMGGALSGKTVTAVSVGYSHACAIANGKPYCWGDNQIGQLGNNTTTNSSVPVAVAADGVLNGKTVTAINTGAWHTCVLADGKPYCWGDNWAGALGDNTTIDRHVPVATTTSGVLNGKSVTAIELGEDSTCAIADAKAYCWGSNESGQLGNNSNTSSSVPVAVTTSGVLGGKAITSINMGYAHVCAVGNAKPYCWGTAGDGQLGNNATTVSWVPVAVSTSGVLNGKVVLEVGAMSPSSAALAMDDPGFCDVTSSAPFFADIVWLAGVGISTGSGGCFQPGTSVSRQAMAAFLYRALNPGAADPTCTGTTRTFTDVPSSHPFCGTIEWLESEGITGGYPDGTFKATGTVTRQAMAAFLFRALNPGKADPVCTGTDRTFTDVPTTNGFCGPIEWLAQTGVTGGYADGTFQPGGTVSRQAMAAFLHRALT